MTNNTASTFDDQALHEQMTWRLYLLGTLDNDADLAFERHLARCDECQTNCDEYGELITGLALLSEESIALAVAPSAAPTRPALASVPTDSPAPPTPLRSGSLSDRPVPRRAPARWSPSRPLFAAVAAALVLVVGGVLAFAVWPTGSAVVAVRNEQTRPQGTPVHLSVTVVDHNGQSTIRATLVGLTAGTRYRLYGVTTAAQTILAKEWEGKAGVQEITGEVTARAQDLALITVTTVDGRAVASAQLPH